MNKQDALDKRHHLEYFRERGKEALIDLEREIGHRNYKELAAALNKTFQDSARNVLNSLLSQAATEQWAATDKLSAILMATYASYIAMLEFRNEVSCYAK